MSALRSQTAVKFINGLINYKTHMRPRFELIGMNCILVKTLPAFELHLGSLLVVLIPLQHSFSVRNAYTLAVGFDDAAGIVQEIISVDNTNIDMMAIRDTVGAIGSIFISRSGHFGTDEAFFTDIVEEAAKFVIPSFRGVEIVPACHGAKWLESAAEVRWDAGSRMTNEEGEVEAGKELLRYDRRIALLSRRRVRQLHRTVQGVLGDRNAVRAGTVQINACGRANTTFVSDEGWSKGSWFAMGWEPVLCHVLDENALSLSDGESPLVLSLVTVT